MRVNLTSNGIVMDKQRARAWIDAGLRAASFSLDGVRRKTHDKIRGIPGAFKRTVRAIEILRRETDRRKSKLALRINVVLSRKNLPELPGLIRFAAELGAVDVVPMPIDGKKAKRPSRQEIYDFNRDIVPEVRELRIEHGMPTDLSRLYPFGRTDEECTLASKGEYAFGYYDKHRCYVPYLHTFVSHTGEVYACCMTRGGRQPLGNLATHSIADIFQGRAYREFRCALGRRRLPVCGRCDQFLRENHLVESRLEQQRIPTGAQFLEETVS
jgi:MoaA/NifB/PqqE/SkfB family radical SAM enzyme